MMRYVRVERNHLGEWEETSSLNTFQFSLDEVLGKCPSGNQLTAATGDYNCTTQKNFSVSEIFWLECKIKPKS